MSFLHWFKKAARNTETGGKPSSGRKSSPEPPAVVNQTTAENSRPEVVAQAPAIEQQSVSLPVPLSATATPRQADGAKEGPTPTPDFSVPDGDFQEHTPPIAVAEPAARPLESPTQARGDAPAHQASGLEPVQESGSIVVETSERKIRLRLEPILSNFPPDLEQSPLPVLGDTTAEIILPLDLIQSQLAEGRVVVSAAMLRSVLPSNLKPYFEAIDPGAEIPIPLREIFLRLPPGLIKLREDQEIDPSEPAILTPFSKEVEEDAKRVEQSAPTPSEPTPQVLKIPFTVDSERLNAIFMTDEILDLPKTLGMVAELPGLRACLLNTTDGRKVAGTLDDPSQEQAISALVPVLFKEARPRFASMSLGKLETITLFFSQNQISTFIQGKFCLTVLHDGRPFKPGVREKVRAVISELATLNTFEKEP